MKLQILVWLMFPPGSTRMQACRFKKYIYICEAFGGKGQSVEFRIWPWLPLAWHYSNSSSYVELSVVTCLSGRLLRRNRNQIGGNDVKRVKLICKPYILHVLSGLLPAMLRATGLGFAIKSDYRCYLCCAESKGKTRVDIRRQAEPDKMA